MVGMKEISELVRKAFALVEKYEYRSFWFGVRSGKIDEDKKKEIRKRLIEEYGKLSVKEARPDAQDVLFTVNIDRGWVKVYVDSVCLCGRYCKYERGIAQTVHHCRKCRGTGSLKRGREIRVCKNCSGTGKISEESVEELVSSLVIPKFGASGEKFHGMGREDADVRMLGEGRPFVLELLSPLKRRGVDLTELQKEINSKFEGKIEIKGLEYCGKDEVAKVKDAGALHWKEYLAKVNCGERVRKRDFEAIIELIGKEIVVQQRTPLRVAGRRSDKVREKSAVFLEVNEIEAEEETKGHVSGFEIKVRGSAGLYIKELVSGDMARTRPSLSSVLGVKCECVALDVLRVAAD